MAQHDEPHYAADTTRRCAAPRSARELLRQVCSCSPNVEAVPENGGHGECLRQAYALWKEALAGSVTAHEDVLKETFLKLIGYTDHRGVCH